MVQQFKNTKQLPLFKNIQEKGYSIHFNVYKFTGAIESVHYRLLDSFARSKPRSTLGKLPDLQVGWGNGIRGGEKRNAPAPPAARSSTTKQRHMDNYEPLGHFQYRR